MKQECTKCDKLFETTSETVEVCPACSRAYRIETGQQKPDGWIRKTADLVAYQKAWREANAEKIREYQKNRPKRTPEQEKAKYLSRMRRIHGEGWKPRSERPKDPLKEVKRKAMVTYRTALKRGKLTRTPCHICGDEKVEGHHPDYSRPLDVVWLCKAHHLAIHNS
jgi:predicted  nucleic acid-binding Zn-ribbon protein